MSIAQKPIVVVGSINIDFVVTAKRIPLIGETLIGHDFQLHFGGKGANQAVAAARLGYPVEMIGMVGSDTFGAQVRAGLDEAGVGISAVGTAEGSTGVAVITVSDKGENTIVVTPGANGRVSPEYLGQHEKLLRNAGMVLAQLEIPMETVEHLVKLCSRYGVPLILDPAPAQPLTSQTLSQVSWFTPNETEAAFFAERIDPALVRAEPSQMAAAFLRMGVGAAALKMGSRGVLLLSRDMPAQMLRAIRVDAVDSTAAGDAFNGAFATGLMLGMPAVQAGRFACAAAAISVTRRGAQPSMPERFEVEKLLQSLA